MRDFFAKKPWLPGLLSAVMCLALLAGLLLPFGGSATAQPENPILRAHAQELTVLETGGGAGADAVQLPEQALPDTQPEESQTDEPADEPMQNMPDNAQTVTALPSSDAPQSVPTAEKPGIEDVDLSAVLTWYRYGTRRASVVCGGDSTVRRTIPAAQLPQDGAFRYALELDGVDADNAQITAVRFGAEDGRSSDAAQSGTVHLDLPEGGKSRGYIFTAEALLQRPDEDAQTVTFTFQLVIKNELDLDLRLSWRTREASDDLRCTANGSAYADLAGEELADGVFAYSFAFEGLDAEDARFVSCEYWTDGGESGKLLQNGRLQMHAADGSDRQTYHLTVRAQTADGEDTAYDVTLTYIEQPYELQLQFTWYQNGTQAAVQTCQPDTRTALTIYREQLRGDELRYALALTGRDAENAQLVAATLDDTALRTEGQGSILLETGESGTREYTLLATARVRLVSGAERDVPFSLTIRYSAGVRLALEYAVNADGEAVSRTLYCENGKTAAAAEIYSDQLTEGLLSYHLRADGGALTLTGAEYVAESTARSEPAGVPDGSVTLRAREDGSVGENTLTVQAQDGAGRAYSFTFRLPYKQRGKNCIVITTDPEEGATLINEAENDLVVTARVPGENGAKDRYLTATGVNTTLTVQLDGKDCRLESTSGNAQQYLVTPENTEGLDENEHTLYVYAEDEYGNYGEKTVKFRGVRAEPGTKIGTATFYVDLTVLGLDTSRTIEVDVLAGEPISYTIAKAVWNEDTGEPFGKAAAKQTLNWPAARCTYSGTLGDQFYLQRLDDGSNFAAHADVLTGEWSDYGATEAEQLAAIDREFGADTPQAALWRCILCNGIPLSGASSRPGVGEFDFTMASGWLYSLNGSYYPGTAMSAYRLKDGDQLALRFTLAYGCDVGAPQGDYGSSVGYCVRALGGEWTVEHQYEEVTQPDGTVQYVCRCCGAVTKCPHLKTEYRMIDDKTCALFCANPDCGEQVGKPEAHAFTLTQLDAENPDAAEKHSAVCSHCGCAAELAHDWQRGEDTATCLEPGMVHLTCACGAEKDEESPARGHDAHWCFDTQEHWQECSRCGVLEDTRGEHDYRQDGDDWTCSRCEVPHMFACLGAELTPVEANTSCYRQTFTCDLCGRTLTRTGEFHEFENGECTVCGKKEFPDEDDESGGDDSGDE